MIVLLLMYFSKTMCGIRLVDLRYSLLKLIILGVLRVRRKVKMNECVREMFGVKA